MNHGDDPCCAFPDCGRPARWEFRFATWLFYRPCCGVHAGAIKARARQRERLYGERNVARYQVRAIKPR